MDRLDEYLQDVNELDKKLLKEAGRRVLTKERWAAYNKFKTEKESLELQVVDAQKKYDEAVAEQDGLTITNESEEVTIPQLQRILTAERAMPAIMMQECYAMILHEHKSLDFIRQLSPDMEKVLFNFELKPLRDEVEKMKKENYELRKANPGANQVQVNYTPNDSYAGLQKELADAKARNHELLERFGDLDQATQRIAETQLNQAQDSPALGESLSNLKIEVASLKAEIATKDKKIQIQERKLNAFQKSFQAFESRALAGDRAVEKATHANGMIEELRKELHVKKYDLNSSTQLNDFLRTQLAKLNDDMVAQFHAMDAYYEYQIEGLNSNIGSLDSSLSEQRALNTALWNEIHGPGGFDETVKNLERGKDRLKFENGELLQQTTELKSTRDSFEKGAQHAAGKLASEKSAVQRELRMLKGALKECLSQALPLAQGDDSVLSALIDIWASGPLSVLPVTPVTGTQNSASWIIKAPVTASSSSMTFENHSNMSLATKLFALVHTRRHEGRLALEVLPELIRRMPKCNESWVARILLACVATFNAGRGTVVKTMETSSVSLSLLQLHIEVRRRFPALWSQAVHNGAEINNGLQTYTQQCNELLGEVCEKLCSAEHLESGISALQSSLKERMVQYPIHGLSLISDTTTEWVFVISEAERTITPTSKLLFQLDNENTTFTHWAISVKEPSELSNITFIDDIEAVECRWWREQVLEFLPFSDNLNNLIRDLKLE